MTKESRVEVIIFSALAAFAVALWWMNRQAGAGSGLADQGLNVDLPGLASGSYSPGNVGGLTLNFGSPGALPGPVTSPAGGSSCGCPTCTGTPSSVAFGTPDQLIAWLQQQGVLSATQNALNGGWN